MKSTTINANGKLLNLSLPLVMGIVNMTTDSFFDGGKYIQFADALHRCEKLLEEGADILDLGACSTRPDSKLVSADEEIAKLIPLIKEVKKQFPKSIISVDTVWSKVVKAVAEEGVNMINDISGGMFDNQMFATIAQCGLPYVLTHNVDTPDKMQNQTHYNNLIMDIVAFFTEKIESLRNLGVKDIILDLGFGFGKTLEQNYELLRKEKEFEIFELPILVGISRKSMIYKPLGITPEQSLNGTSCLNIFALLNGADILRVHDVKEAKQCIELFLLYNGFTNN